MASPTTGPEISAVLDSLIESTYLNTATGESLTKFLKLLNIDTVRKTIDKNVKVRQDAKYIICLPTINGLSWEVRNAFSGFLFMKDEFLREEDGYWIFKSAQSVGSGHMIYYFHADDCTFID